LTWRIYVSAPVPAPDDPTPIDPVTDPPWRPGDGNPDQPNPARGEEGDDGDELDDEEDDDDSEGGSSVGNG